MFYSIAFLLQICFIVNNFSITLRLSGVLLYGIEAMSLQIFLINQRILQVCDDHPDYDKLKVGQKIFSDKIRFSNFAVLHQTSHSKVSCFLDPFFHVDL
jgi:hypothetical protein